MTANIAARNDWVDVRFRYLAEVQKGCLPSPVIDTLLDIEWVPYLTMEYLRGESGEPTLVPLDDKLVVADDGSILLLWDGANAGEFLRAKRGVVSSTSALVTPSLSILLTSIGHAKARKTEFAPKLWEWIFST